MASANHLDDLLNTVYLDTEYGSVTTQSQVSNATSISSVTLMTTGAPGMIGIASPLATYKIALVNDANNTITLAAQINGMTVGSQTDFVFGFAPNGSILISPNTEADVANQYAMGENSIADSLLSILSPTPITAGMTETFTANGATSSPSSVANPPVTVVDTTTGKAVPATAQPYTGTVPNIQDQYINVTSDNLNVTSTTPNMFIHTGSGEDAINVSSQGGTNVLDGSTGSNFLVGGLGNDTFFLDDRTPPASLWSTIEGFHSGDNASIFGVTQMGFTITNLDNLGAPGATGLTIDFSKPGLPDARITLAGFNSAELTTGQLTESFGTESDGTPFMNIHGN